MNNTISEQYMFPLGRKRLYKLALRDGLNCRYCFAVTTINREVVPTPNRATVDHIIPKSQGGKDHIDNCVIACQQCNVQKGSSLLYRTYHK